MHDGDIPAPRRLLIHRVAFSLVLTTLLGLFGTHRAAALGGPFDPASWTVSGPGISSISASGGGVDLRYSINPAGLRVTQTWTFTSTAASTGTLNYQWTYNFFHAYYQVYATLTAFSNGPAATMTQLVNFYGPGNTGSQSFNGTGQLPVSGGFTFGFIVSGSNYDLTNILQGDVILTGAIVANPSSYGATQPPPPAPVAVVWPGLYALTVGTQGCGRVSPTGTAPHEFGDNVIVTATPCPGSLFRGWSGGGCDAVKAPTCVVGIPSYSTVTAIFVP